MISVDPVMEDRDGHMLMADKGYRSASFEADLNNAGSTRSARSVRGEKTQRPLTKFLKPFRQIIESVNHILKGQLNFERHRDQESPPAYAPASH